MAKVRVYELAKELGIESKVVMAKLQEMGEFVRFVGVDAVEARETQFVPGHHRRADAGLAAAAGQREWHLAGRCPAQDLDQFLRPFGLEALHR